VTKHDEDEQPGGLDVQLAAELVERARAEGVSLVGPDGLAAASRSPGWPATGPVHGPG
jgi:putative transposase